MAAASNHAGTSPLFSSLTLSSRNKSQLAKANWVSEAKATRPKTFSVMRRRRSSGSSSYFDDDHENSVAAATAAAAAVESIIDVNKCTSTNPIHDNIINAPQRFVPSSRSTRRRERTGRIVTTAASSVVRSIRSSSSSPPLPSFHCSKLYFVIIWLSLLTSPFTLTVVGNEIVENEKVVDGTFNGYPLRYREVVHGQVGVPPPPPLSTTVHCVGENYQNGTSWMHRSCEFTELFCFDTSTKDYVVFESSFDRQMYKHVDARPTLDISQSYLKQSSTKRNTVSLGGINLKWSMNPKRGIPRLEWFPEIRDASRYGTGTGEPLTYYELPSNVVMIPFHSMNGANPGHLVWDDFLPIFTLLTMFQLDEYEGSGVELLMMRYILKDTPGEGEGGAEEQQQRGLWASCDWSDDKKESCRKMMNKFLPLMMGEESASGHGLTTTEDFRFEVGSGGGGGGEAKSSLVCSRYGLAGIGPLTDHGTYKLHGWEDADYTTTHNHGRGGMLYEFRNFMLSNMNIPTTFRQKPPFRVILSQHSSESGKRSYDFKKQQEILQQNFNPGYVSVEAYTMSELPLREQLELVSQSSIFITGSGGGAVSAMFLPKGSSVILYYPESGGVVGNKPNGKPARLDWDLFNNMSHLRVHWLPMGSMDRDSTLRGLLLLIEHELDGLIREGSYSHFFY